MTVEMFLALCWKRHIKVHRAEKELGYGNGYFRSLKKKEIPANRLQEVANYFGVSLEFMFGATPEAYLLWTEYNLDKAEKAYEKECDPKKRDEIGAEIDALRDSLEDLRLADMLSTKKPAAENGSGGDIVGAEDEVVAKKERIIRMLDNVDPSDYDRAIAILELLLPRQDSQGGSRPKDE